MKHKISEMCTKIDLIKVKSDKLREFKYEAGINNMSKCDYMIADIQQLCRDISTDVGLYKKF